MSIVDKVVELLEVGIKAEGLRQQAIASNIANAQTPGYRRVDVRFEQILAKAIESGRLDPNGLEPQVYRPMQSPVRPDGNDVSLEHEVGQMVQNSIRQRTFVRLLARKYQQASLAMDTGQH
ncbi:MAG: flagellar basal body protein [Sedimentisphaerales bacterium]|nr:flagellar basal body protein [Sedimentisphaerales bacterium]